MTSSQLTELESLWNIEGGWGEWKQDYRIGQLTAILAESNRNSKKRNTPFQTSEFTLRPKDKVLIKKRDNRNKIKQTFEALAKKIKGKANGKHRKSNS